MLVDLDKSISRLFLNRVDQVHYPEGGKYLGSNSTLTSISKKNISNDLANLSESCQLLIEWKLEENIL